MCNRQIVSFGFEIISQVTKYVKNLLGRFSLCKHRDYWYHEYIVLRSKKRDVLLWKTCLNYLPLGWGSWLTNFVKYLCLMSEINQRSKLYLLLMKREILATILYFQGYLFWYFFSKQYQRIGWWDRLLLIFYSNLEMDPSNETVKEGDFPALFLSK